MSISVKCQYGLRALFELAKRKDQGLVRLQDVAEAQEIPQRFLENILNQLRQGGFVESRRGKDGGFVLLRTPSQITIGDIVKFIDGPIYPVECAGKTPVRKCSFQGRCVFSSLWDEARHALERVYEKRTLQDLLDEAHDQICDYVI
ncbi:Rrf2 family transcriptional regulator [Deltaproteobacteria bacterium Smac51]|nr:Rrf2 family transcriptional regulator [Deltaproteobacteria bacterium Smac51]